MPLLPKETEIHPADFFTLDPAEWPWLVAHVRSRQEKVLARQLFERTVPFYLPLITAKRVRAGRKLTSHLPLFPGYVFLRGNQAERDLALRSHVVARFVDVGDPERLASELGQLRDLQLSGASLQPYDALVSGDPVRIREGAFSGYRGVVVREKGEERLVVMVSLINRAVTVEFDRAVLARAGA